MNREDITVRDFYRVVCYNCGFTRMCNTMDSAVQSAMDHIIEETDEPDEQPNTNHQVRIGHQVFVEV